jgi:hypothetical protein
MKWGSLGGHAQAQCSSTRCGSSCLGRLFRNQSRYFPTSRTRSGACCGQRRQSTQGAAGTSDPVPIYVHRCRRQPHRQVLQPRRGLGVNAIHARHGLPGGLCRKRTACPESGGNSRRQRRSGCRSAFWPAVRVVPAHHQGMYSDGSQDAGGLSRGVRHTSGEGRSNAGPLGTAGGFADQMAQDRGPRIASLSRPDFPGRRIA